MICDNDKFPSNLSPDTIYDTVICSLYYIPIYEQVIATRLRLEIFSSRWGETYISPIWHRHRLTNQLPGYEPADGIKNGSNIDLQSRDFSRLKLVECWNVFRIRSISQLISENWMNLSVFYIRVKNISVLIILFQEKRIFKKEEERLDFRYTRNVEKT